MSREIDMLARELQKTPATVMRTELNLYQTNIQSASAAFLRNIEQEAKKEKTATVTLVAVIKSYRN
jgi:hypothetical protein